VCTGESIEESCEEEDEAVAAGMDTMGSGGGFFGASFSSHVPFRISVSSLLKCLNQTFSNQPDATVNWSLPESVFFLENLMV
jgi:hypothetical protein